MTQDELKTQVGIAALKYVTPNTVIGVGTGSTVNKFIDALASAIGRGELKITGAVSSSVASTELLTRYGIPVFEANDVTRLGVYIDGADEIDGAGYMIKGGGAALTREKIVASLADKFVCIADESKLVKVLGAFPLPVEVIPMAASHIQRRFAAKGGTATIRLKDGQPLVTDNGQQILDVTELKIKEPLSFELGVNQWAGVVSVGIFAQQKASVCLLGTSTGVRTIEY
jgi:ribose 5-phosphate isomerase A